MQTHADPIAISGIGGAEDWTVKVENTLTGKRVYVVDTGGTYELCRDITVYAATGNAFASFDEYRDAMARASAEVA